MLLQFRVPVAAVRSHSRRLKHFRVNVYARVLSRLVMAKLVNFSTQNELESAHWEVRNGTLKDLFAASLRNKKPLAGCSYRDQKSSLDSKQITKLTELRKFRGDCLFCRVLNFAFLSHVHNFFYWRSTTLTDWTSFHTLSHCEVSTRKQWKRVVWQ